MLPYAFTQITRDANVKSPALAGDDVGIVNIFMHDDIIRREADLKATADSRMAHMQKANARATADSSTTFFTLRAKNSAQNDTA